MERPSRVSPRSVENWLSSTLLEHIVARIAHECRLSPDDVPDLVQETRLALWEADAHDPIGAAFVARVAKYKAVDLLRRLARSRRRDRTIARSTQPVGEDAELRHLLNVRIAGLPGEFQRLFDLHYRQGWSEREIAKSWGVSRSSVRWLDHCCREVMIGTPRTAQHQEVPPALRMPEDHFLRASDAEEDVSGTLMSPQGDSD